MLHWWREVLITACLVVIGLGIAFWPEPQTITKTKIVTKERVVQPDGTIVEREVVSENNNTAGAVSSIEQASYKVGVSVNPLDYKDIRAEMGARLGKLPLWLEAGYEAKHKSVDVGLSLEF